MKDDLGDRMKGHYEDRARYYLPRRCFTVIRLDGKAFHSFTRNCERPYDLGLMECMDETAKVLCEEIQGAKLAFVQSDEISLVLTDFDTIKTDAWFDGNIQKMVSVAASTATAAFNAIWQQGADGMDAEFRQFALFDARAFVIPIHAELVNYLVWRQQDATRNSISMAAQAYFSHKQLHGVSSNEMQEMLHKKGVNWNDFPIGFKRGRTVVRRKVVKPVTYTDKRTGEEVTKPDVERHEWQIDEPPIFTQHTDYVYAFLPV